MRSKMVLLVLFLSITACGWNYLCTKTTSYNLEEEKIATVGSEMLQAGCFAARWEPMGLTKHLWQRKAYDETHFERWLDKELLYAGREDDVLHITYREYRNEGDWTTPVKKGSIAKPAFLQQSFYYDLKKSDVIMFQNWVIKVLDANNERIKFKVVEGPQGYAIPQAISS